MYSIQVSVSHDTSGTAYLKLRVLIMVYIALVLMVKQILVQFDVLLFHLLPTFSGERKLIAG